MKHLFRFLCMAVLTLTTCVITSCEQKIDTPCEYLGKTKWEHRDHENGVIYYIELERDYNGEREEDRKKNFIYKEYYLEDLPTQRPQYEIIMHGDWTNGYWINQATEVSLYFKNSQIYSTNPGYHNPDLNDYPQKLKYYKKYDKIVYKGRGFERL